MTSATSVSSLSHEKNPAEITPKAIFLSIVLVILLGASNAFLGLKVGTTISTSIPAVVIALSFFRLFRRHNLLETNIVQTAASTGEGITAAMIFSIPALIILHYWTEFHYWETALSGIVGGSLGVLFSIPLRRALLTDKTLNFPEGTAIGQVIKVSADGSNSLVPITMGGLIGALVGLCQSGFRVLAQGYEYWVVKGSSVFGFNLGFSPAVIAAGYICGITAAISILVGVVLGWVIGIPVIAHLYGLPAGTTATDAAQYMWTNYVRYIGVGTMLVGGMWSLIKLIGPVIKGVMASFKSWRLEEKGQTSLTVRTEKDIPFKFSSSMVLLLLGLFFIALMMMFHPESFGISNHLFLFTLAICTVYILVAGFVFSAVSGYFAGLIGMSNSPGSGLMVASLLGLCSILLLILAPHINFSLEPGKGLSTAAFAVMVISFFGAVTAMVGEAIQVAKVGEMVGSTPWKQQVVLIGSVIVASLTIPLVLKLLFNAYGIGGVFPRPGMVASQALSAPQAGLIAAVSQGVFNHQIPWEMLGTGIVIAIIGIVVDEMLKARCGRRLPVLAIGLGIYLRLEVTVPLIIGGLISYFVSKKSHAQQGVLAEKDEAYISSSMQNALMLACGLVAGSTLMGVLLAIPFAIKQSTDVLRLVPDSFVPISGILSVLVTILIGYWMYKVGTKRPISKIKVSH